MENTGNENQGSAVTRHSSMSVFVLVSGIFLLALLGLFGWYVLKTPTVDPGTFSYTIPGVPYIGVHNRVGEQSYVVSDPSAAVMSILEYWNPGKHNFREITNEIRQNIVGGLSTIDHIENYILSLGDYTVEQKRLTIDEIKEYINSKVKTPPFLFLPLTASQPAEPPYYYPATVLIGIDEPEQKVIFSSYWLGNNYEISFDEFQILQNRMLSDDRNKYLIIQPKNLPTALAKLKNLEETSYPPRGIIMNETVEMFKNYTVGLGGVIHGSHPVQESYFEDVINNPKFVQFMPPYFKVYTLYKLAEANLALGRDNEATEYVMRAIELNHDLDEPFEDFPGFEIRFNVPATTIDRVSGPYRVLGDIYMKSNEFMAAKEAYEKALAIHSENSLALSGLQFAEIRLKPEINLNIDTEVFINTLIKKSPWSVSWKQTDDRTGTYKISFASVLGETKLSGRLFDSSKDAQPDDLKNIVIKDNCISFNFISLGIQVDYDQCLTKDGLLEGVLSSIGGGFWAKTISKPSQ